jgi:hypothetical protein
MADEFKDLYFSLKPKAVAVGSARTANNDPGLYKLDTAAGSVLSLPAATGSGKVVKGIVTTTATSNAHKILCAPIIEGDIYEFTDIAPGVWMVDGKYQAGTTPTTPFSTATT